MRVLLGDCVEVLAGLDAGSIDAVVTDPPYGLGDTSPAKVEACLRSWLEGERHAATGGGFMAREWDAWVPGPEVWRECLRVLKPGGHLLAFAGSRTVDLMGLALRLAGFEVRDCLQWLYGSGFPKSLDVSKAMDKSAGAEREAIRPVAVPRGRRDGTNSLGGGWQDEPFITAPATDAARRWQGWGTALKPAAEPILLCRKPIDGTVARNVEEHGTGALNVDGCRVDGAGDKPLRAPRSNPRNRTGAIWSGWRAPYDAMHNHRAQAASIERTNTLGRWPPNVLLGHAAGCEGDRSGRGCVDGCAVGELGAQSGEGVARASHVADGRANVGASIFLDGWRHPAKSHDDTGTAARFFPSFRYVAKASRGEREAGLTGAMRRWDESRDPAAPGANNPRNRSGADGRSNHHPTVKPVEVMRWLVRLVAPPGGVVLDPFAGSGTTGCACVVEGVDFLGVEREPEYAELARERIEWWTEHGERAVAAWAAKTGREERDEASGQLGLFGE